MLWLILLSCARPPLQSGAASWYGAELAGRPTASGAPFDPSALTAAHPWLPLGTVLRVTRIDTGASVRVTINDRGPAIRSRILDLSEAAAERIGMISAGVVQVELRVQSCPRPGACELAQ